MIQFLLCPFVSPCPYISASIPDLFVRPSSFQLTYISLVCHVCLLSLYIDFNSTSTVTLHLCVIWVFRLAVFPALETARLSQLCYSSSRATGNLAASLRLIGCAYTHLSLKYLDRDRRLVQCTSWSHCPNPPSNLETYETQSSHRVA